MAHLGFHGQIIEVWKHPTTDERYHFTNRQRVLVTTGPRKGGAKMARRNGQMIESDEIPSFKRYLELSGFIKERAS